MRSYSSFQISPQITTYTHKDENNKFVIKPHNKQKVPKDKLQLLKHGDLIRLEHLMTKRNLHSHAEPSAMTKKHHQVTGYGEVCTLTTQVVWIAFNPVRILEWRRRCQ